MISVIVVFAIVTVLSCPTEAGYQNTFEATKGCLKYNSHQGYKFTHPYFSTGAYRNVRRGPNNATEFRFGVLGDHDGIFRLAPVQNPYDSTLMHEIVLSGLAGTKTDVRRYVRTSPSEMNNYSMFKIQSSYGLLSQFDPLMFTLTIYSNGSAKLAKDGDKYPFFEFQDSTLSFRYIGFCNWNVPVIYFFDCPL
uniref:(northern house mosquito) hypothetical protein n=2 Tax=Culex pipiens TaxID=7175 RepID=A0A8D8CKB2_CULPI